LVGAPMESDFFAPMADALAGEFTVVSTDPRGISRSTLDDPEQDSTPELRADDIVHIIDALGGGPVDFFGSSCGAITGIALVARRPERRSTTSTRPTAPRANQRRGPSSSWQPV
jgi:pimeloyl-ACP methyl ester carboxylesterase